MQESVVAVFTCQKEVFSIRRQNYLRAFPGYYAFPGGKVDEEDYEFDLQHELLDEFPNHEIGALFREIQEELGYSLKQGLEDGMLAGISKLGEAIPPITGRVKFKTHYYKVELHEKPVLSVDSGEIAWSDWLPSTELYQLYTTGKGLMVVPTERTMHALSQDITQRELTDFNHRHDREWELPYLELQNGVGFIPVPSNTLPPATTTNSLLLGDEGSPKILTDPSPSSDDVLRKLLNTLEHCTLDAILITHHHRDHHERAPQIARQLGIPILCSEITEQRITNTCGKGYFDEIEIRHTVQDQVITQWLSHNVICHELPGHDDGMVGLAAKNMAWFYIADLAEPGTTVVIPEPEGDMAVYFDTLKRVIGQKPGVVIPSHGMPMGGTHLLKKTLAHRIKREKQIMELLSEGVGEDNIVDVLYEGVDERLLPLAHQNVRQHFKKIRNSSSEN